MKTPESLETLVDYGIIQEVIRPLMSGKEAQVFVVVSGGVECVAKVYKEANQRTFKHRVEYTEGRKTRNTRDQRAINKRTRHGKAQDEAAWRNAEVDTLYRVRAGGVCVPEPINFVDGVLVMELVRDAEGNPAPRLGDLDFSPEEAYEIYKKLMAEVVRMLCAGAIHGDLSEFNVLLGADGPVVIDFPQSIDPSKNPSARKLLLRDVANLHRFLSRHAPGQAIKPLGEEIWALYEKNRLSPNTELLGDYVAPTGDTDMSEVLALIEDANQDEQMRREGRGDDTPLVAPPSPFRRVVDFSHSSKPKPRAQPAADPTPRGRRSRRRGAKEDSGQTAANGPRSAPDERKQRAAPKPAGPSAATDGDRAAPKRRRRRRRSAGSSSGSSGGGGGGGGEKKNSTSGPGPRTPASDGGKNTARPGNHSKPGAQTPTGPRRRRRRPRAPESR